MTQYWRAAHGRARQTAKRLLTRTEATTSARAEPVVGIVDRPRPGELLQRGTLVVHGWHLSGQDPAVAVAVYLDETLVGRAAVVDERPDLVETIDNPGVGRSGWSVPIRLDEDLTLGEHVFTIAVWGKPSEPPQILPSIPVRLTATSSVWSTSRRGHLDWPLEGSAVESGVCVVSGWALYDDQPCSSVEIAVNGIDQGAARIGIDRADVAQVHPFPHASFSGFELMVDLAEGDSPAHIEIYTRRPGEERSLLTSAIFEVAPDVDQDPGLTFDSVEPLAKAPTPTSESGRETEGMKLVCMTHDLGLGGGQLWLSEALYKSGAGRDFACTVVSPRPGPLRQELEDHNIQVHITQDFPITNFESYEGRSQELASWLDSQQFDVALVNTFSSFSGADILSRLDIPLVWAIHESFEPSRFWKAAYGSLRLDRRVQALAMSAIKRAKAVVFEAEATRQQWAPYCGDGRSMILPYGIDTSAIQTYCDSHDRTEIRAALGYTPDQRVILVMGTIEPRKAQSLAAQAFANLAEHHPSVALVMVGDTGAPYGEALREYAALVGLESQIRIVPVVPDTYEWYRAADVLLCASDIESLPRSVLEAMAFGVTILATEVFGLAELIEDGVTGFLYPPRDLGETRSALQRVLNLPESELVQIGQAGRDLVRTRHDSSGYANSLRSLLEALAEDPDVLPESILG
jgi:glycosyltransferase involved in cell wall biosynthesis